MLALLDWIVPSQTQKIMTAADWLLVVLASYFHDLGMIVTRDEYSNRNSSGFIEYRQKLQNLKDNTAKDYAARIQDLEDEEAERFLYQEYVRENHPKRIRAWIEGRKNTALGITETMAAEVLRILEPLETVFREDLAIICESHHLDDLDNIAKYPVSRPYGQPIKRPRMCSMSQYCLEQWIFLTLPVIARRQ